MKCYLKPLIIPAIAIIFIAVFFLTLSPATVAPEIGRDLPEDFAEADKVFAERVRDQLSSLTDDVLTELLAEQGFKIQVAQGIKYAEFSGKRVSCSLRWLISWTPHDNSIDDLKTVYGGTCR